MGSKNEIPTVSAAQLNDIFLELRRLGLTTKEIQGQTEIKEQGYTAVDGRIDVLRAQRLWDLLGKSSGDPLCALKIGQVVSQQSMGVLANLFLSCETLDEALDMSIRYFKLLNEVDEISRETSENILSYIYSNKIPEYYNPYNVDRSLSAATAWVRFFTGRDYRPLEIRFTYPEPKHAEEIRAFFNCPVRFKQKRNELLYDASYLKAKNPRRNDYLKKLLEARAKNLNAHLTTNQNLSQKLKAILSEELPGGEVALGPIAARLNMSRTTLYRKLREEGTSFQSLQEELRRELSEYYLKDMKFSQQETAFMLGYSEVSAFSRAYKRWFGRSPGSTQPPLNNNS